MPWVTVHGQHYYRRSRRVGGRVVTEHVGAGPRAERDADAADRERRRTTGIAGVMVSDRPRAGLVAGAAVGGFYRHRRPWWKRRGADMASRPGRRRWTRCSPG